MPPQMYLVEWVSGESRPKTVVSRWVVIATSDKEAIYDVARRSCRKFKPTDEEIEAQLLRGVWSASMVGQGMQLNSVVRDA